MSSHAVGWVFHHSPLTGSQLLVHLALADVANDMNDNELWLTHKAVAEKAKVSGSTVDRALAEMVAGGLLEVLDNRGGRGRPARYRLLIQSTSGRRGIGGKARHPVAESTSPCVESTSSATSLLIPNKKNSRTTTEVNFDSPAGRVFGAWVEVTGRDRARTKLTKDRKDRIARALKDYPEEDLIDAVRGITRSAFHCGQNDRSTRYDDIQNAFKSSAHIEQFRDLWRDPRSAAISRNATNGNGYDKFAELDRRAAERAAR